MRNRVTNVFSESSDRTGVGDTPWDVARHPGARLFWLFVVMVLPIGAVAVRLIHLQTILAQRFATAFDFTTESSEPIPTRAGRILATDGRILAYDVEHFDVRLHYRWLEEPPNLNWLHQQALSRLPQLDRRNAHRVAVEVQEILAQREAVWNRLAQLSLTPRQQLDAERQRVQKRVERIITKVNSRRRRKRRQNTAVDRGNSRPAWWQAAWQTLSAALTTEPHRYAAEPLVIQEEFDYHTIIHDVPREVAVEIEAHPERFPGVRIRGNSQRAYPQKMLAAHIIGYRIGVGNEELKARKQRFPDGDPLDYRAGDRIGKTGVERSYDQHLHGLRGLRRIVKNRRGEVVRVEIIREPRIGRDVVLTLDLALQHRAEQLIDEALDGGAESSIETDQPRPAGGSIVAIDVHTGAVLAAASGPRYNLNLLVEPDSQAWKRLLDDPRRPFFPRATRMTLPPGSVFKTLTSIALLQSRKLDPDETIHCRGFLETPNRHRCYIYRKFGVGHGDMDLIDALSRSCNVYFFSAADRMGPYPLVHWAERFGFGRPTGIDLPGERSGNLPSPPGDPSETNQLRQTRWRRNETLGLAIGQSRLTVTPLQIARMMAAVANDGYLVTPHVVRDGGLTLIDDEPNSAFTIPEPRRIPELDDGTLQRIRGGLEKAVSHPRGTGYKRVRLDEISIAGKTGTAEVGGGKPDHAWFAGYVPANRPRIAFVVVLEHAGSGGRVAGPVAKRLIQSMLEFGILEPAKLSMRE